jgi:hypothetical protein
MNIHRTGLIAALIAASALVAHAQETGKTGEASCPL